MERVLDIDYYRDFCCLILRTEKEYLLSFYVKNYFSTLKLESGGNCYSH